MSIRGPLAAALSLGLLAGCTQGLLAERSVFAGLEPFPQYEGPLVPILDKADDTPAKQGLLYTAMVDSEVAVQYASRALADTNDLGRMQSAIGEVVYAIDPEQAPAWTAKQAGFVESWAGRGFGVRRAVSAMRSDLGALHGAGSASAVLAEHGSRATACTANTLSRADRIVTLSRGVLGAGSPAGLEATLQEIYGLARELNWGAAGSLVAGDQPAATCGLEQVKRDLDRAAAGIRAS